MKKLASSCAAAILTSGLLFGASAAAQADPGPITTCYGTDGSQHVWNLFDPEDQYFMDSCTASSLVLARNVFGSYAAFAGVALSRLPVGYPVSVISGLWAMDSVWLSQCAGNGSGFIITQNSSNGMVVLCSPQ